MESFQQLIEIVKTLRGPEGCPWDKEQTHSSLTPFAIEEAHEVEEAVNNGDMENLKEELGDLLFQSLLHSQIAKESGHFDIQDVVEHLNHKMITRHPHVFSDVKVDSAQGAKASWEAIKAQEKASASTESKTSETLMAVPRNFPALLRAQKIGKKTAKVGFDWDSSQQVLAKVDEELAELKEAMATSSNIEEELGDLLFSLSQLARHLNLDAETSLRKGNEKFIKRFKAMENTDPNFVSLSKRHKEDLWNRVKKRNH